MKNEWQDLIEKFKENLRALRRGEIERAHIADLPEDIARERGIPREIFIDMKAIGKIERTHRVKVDNKFIENLDGAEALVFYKRDPAKINFIRKVTDNRFLVVGTRRFNNHFVVTGLETTKAGYIESIKKRGEVINIAGRAPFSSIAQPSEEDRRQLELSGVGNITTSLSKNIAEKPEKVKDLEIGAETKEPKKKSRGRGFSL